MKKRLIKRGFSVAELMVTMLVIAVVAAALVPMIGPKKIRSPREFTNHGVFECFYRYNEATGDFQLMQYYRDPKNPSASDTDAVPAKNASGEPNNEYCTFNVPRASFFKLMMIGGGGDAYGSDKNGEDLAASLKSGLLTVKDNGEFEIPANYDENTAYDKEGSGYSWGTYRFPKMKLDKASETGYVSSSDSYKFFNNGTIKFPFLYYAFRNVGTTEEPSWVRKRYCYNINDNKLDSDDIQNFTETQFNDIIESDEVEKCANGITNQINSLKNLMPVGINNKDAVLSDITTAFNNSNQHTYIFIHINGHIPGYMGSYGGEDKNSLSPVCGIFDSNIRDYYGQLLYLADSSVGYVPHEGDSDFWTVLYYQMSDNTNIIFNIYTADKQTGIKFYDGAADKGTFFKSIDADEKVIPNLVSDYCKDPNDNGYIFDFPKSSFTGSGSLCYYTYSYSDSIDNINPPHTIFAPSNSTKANLYFFKPFFEYEYGARGNNARRVDKVVTKFGTDRIAVYPGTSISGRRVSKICEIGEDGSPGKTYYSAESGSSAGYTRKVFVENFSSEFMPYFERSSDDYFNDHSVDKLMNFLDSTIKSNHSDPLSVGLDNGTVLAPGVGGNASLELLNTVTGNYYYKILGDQSVSSEYYTDRCNPISDGGSGSCTGFGGNVLAHTSVTFTKPDFDFNVAVRDSVMKDGKLIEGGQSFCDSINSAHNNAKYEWVSYGDRYFCKGQKGNPGMVVIQW